jgi:glycosyltransferase involved in cell wall biosynthesis
VDVLLIYQWCTFGGVERMIVNRAEAFRRDNRRVRISIGFLHDYQGNLPAYRAYIRALGLDAVLSAFLIRDESFPSPGRYDMVLPIDTPQVFDRLADADNVFVECHTPYKENRQYLADLPQNIRGILAPSKAFQKLLIGEFARLPPVAVLPNPVADEFFHIPRSTPGGIFPKSPIAYLARLDYLKNYREAVRIFRLLSGDERIMFAIVGWGAEQETLHAELTSDGILGKTFLRERMDLGDVPAFIGMIRDHRGIFLSPSKGESFGLSAAEFISAGVPVLLSDIPPHRELVECDENHLYPLGGLPEAQAKILRLLEDWEKASKRMAAFGRKFSGSSFLRAWDLFLAPRP